MSVHSYVPDAFRYGFIIPLVKDKSDELVILIMLVITEILLLYPSLLTTDDLQFGFKSAVGCSQAVFTLQMAKGTLIPEAVLSMLLL